ncbi:MAG: HDOD domain-containing protein [Methylococcaceae bacterium]|nr:HDOD domain-containing protein [Methylococcaceae bacterium]
MELEHLLNNSQNLPAIPEVVRSLIQSFNDEYANITQIAKTISMDQALAGRVLKLANSARYGLPRKVASIDDAVRLLGFTTLRTLVVASALSCAFRAPASLDLKAFWLGSFATAGYAAWLARLGKHREDIAFTGGLMLHSGVLLLHMEAPLESQRIDREVEQGRFRPEAERAVFGFSHVDVSSELAVRWNFPDEIVCGMRDFADPETTASFEPYGAIYRIADFLADAQVKESGQEYLDAHFPGELCRELGQDPDFILSNLPPLATVLDGLDDLLG